MNNISHARVVDFVDELEQTSQVIGLVLLRNGRDVIRFCKKPYEADEQRLLFSLTKSFTGLGVGIASDLGIISLDDLVISYFTDKLPPVISENLAKMRIRHLLTMSSGIHENTYAELYPQEDWVKAFLAQEFVHEPGTFYRYSTHASHMLSAIVERAANQSFYTFMKKRLLEPIGIENSSWEYCKQGITAGGMGLSVPLDAIAKFGQLLLDKGQYNGRQIVSAEYIEMAVSPQISKGTLDKPSRSKNYGYQLHLDKTEGCFFADGAFGQLCYVVPHRRIVLAVSSRNSKVDTIINALWDKALCAPDSSINGKPFDFSNMSFELPRTQPQTLDLKITGTYKLAMNVNELEYIKIARSDSIFELYMHYRHCNNSVFVFSFDKPVRQRAVFKKDINYHMQNYTSYACLKGNNTLELTIILTETPYVMTCALTFDSGKIRFSFDINVSLALKSFSCECALCECE